MEIDEINLPMRGEWLIINCNDLTKKEKETLVDLLMVEQNGKKKK